MVKLAILKSHLGGSQGGLEKYTFRLAKAFLDKGCELTFLSTGQMPTEKLPGAEFIRLSSGSKLGWLQLLKYDQACANWIKNHEPDLVFGMDRNRYQTHYRAGNGVHAAYLERRKATESLSKRMSFQWNPMHREILSIEKEAFESPYLRVLFTNSYMVRDEVLEHYATDPAKVQVVHNGVEWKAMEGDFKTWRVMRREQCRNLGLDPDLFQFLFIGKGFKRKGLESVLRGLSACSDKNFQFSIVGGDRDSRKFESLAKSLGLEKQVYFFGPQDHVRKFYQVCDCLTIPSMYDPFANVTVEALAMGLFVISSKSNGGSEVLSDSSGIVLENPEDKDAMLAALEEAMKRKKNADSASTIRNSVEHLDFSLQLGKIVDTTLESVESINR